MMIPDALGSVILIADWDNDYIHFVDLSAMSEAPIRPTGLHRRRPYGWGDCGQIMYQDAATSTRSTSPGGTTSPSWPDLRRTTATSIDVLGVPAMTNPPTARHQDRVDNHSDDIVAIRPAGNGNVALGLYDGQVAVYDEQFNSAVAFDTIGAWDSPRSGRLVRLRAELGVLHARHGLLDPRRRRDRPTGAAARTSSPPRP